MPISEKSSIPAAFSRMVPIVAAGLLFWIVYIVLTYTKPPSHGPDIITLRSWQEADAPLGLPVDLKKPSTSEVQIFNPHFHFHSPWERAAIPRVDVLEAAMGTETGALTYNAQKFNEQNNSRGGGNHSGDDINGIGGQNSDLGDPVYAVANGLVVYIGEPSPGWGNCIVLAHRTPDGEITHSMYAHLLSTHVYYHQQIPRGYRIGAVGNAGKSYWAHLHLEMRHSDGVSPFLDGYPTLTQHDRLDPTAIIKKFQAKDKLQLAPSVFNIVQKNLNRPDLEMDPESMMKFLEFKSRAEKTEGE